MEFRGKLFMIYTSLSLLLINTASAMNTITYMNTSIEIDIVNNTYMNEWLYYLIITNKSNIWTFPIFGFTSSILKLFNEVFIKIENINLLYLILWGLFIMMVWKQSGKITIPSIIACITAGAWSLLFPESAQPWVLILLAAALASQVLTFFAKE